MQELISSSEAKNKEEKISIMKQNENPEEQEIKPSPPRRRIRLPNIPRPFIIATLLSLLSISTSLFFWFILLNDPFVNTVISSIESFPLLPSLALVPSAHTLKVSITTFSGFFVLVSCFSSWFFVRRRNRRKALVLARKSIGEMEQRVLIMIEHHHKLQELGRIFLNRAFILQQRFETLPQMIQERQEIVSAQEQQERITLISRFEQQSKFLEASRRIINEETTERLQIREPFSKSLELLKRLSNCMIREITARRAIYSDFAISYQRTILTEATAMCLREEPHARASLMNEECIIERRGRIRHLYRIEGKILDMKLRGERAVRGSTILTPERFSFARIQHLFSVQKEEVESRVENILKPEEKELHVLTKYFLENIHEPVHRAELVSASFASTSLDELFSSFLRHCSNIEAHNTILQAKLQLLQDDEMRKRSNIIVQEEEHERSKNIENNFHKEKSFIIRLDEVIQEEAEIRRKLLVRSEKIEFSELVQEINVDRHRINQMERLYYSPTSTTSLSPSPKRRIATTTRSLSSSSSLSKSRSHHDTIDGDDATAINKENTSPTLMKRNISASTLLHLCSSAESIDSPSRKRKDDLEEKRSLLLQYLKYKMRYLRFSLEGDLRSEIEAEETFQRLDLKQSFFVRLGILEEVERKRKLDELEARRLRDEEDQKNISSLIKSEEEAREWWEMRSDAELGTIQGDFRLAQGEIGIRVALFAKEALARERYLRAEKREWRSILREAVDDGLFDVDTMMDRFSGFDGTTSYAFSPVAAGGGSASSPLSNSSSGAMMMNNSVAGGSLTFPLPNMSLSSFDGSFGSFSSFLSPMMMNRSPTTFNNKNANLHTSLSVSSLQQQLSDEVLQNQQQQSSSPSKSLFATTTTENNNKTTNEDDASTFIVKQENKKLTDDDEDQEDFSSPPPQTADELERTQHFEQHQLQEDNNNKVKPMMNLSLNGNDDREGENDDPNSPLIPQGSIRKDPSTEEEEEDKKNQDNNNNDDSDDEEFFEVEVEEVEEIEEIEEIEEVEEDEIDQETAQNKKETENTNEEKKEEKQEVISS